MKTYFLNFIPDKGYLKTEKYILKKGFKLLGIPPHEVFPYSYVFGENIHLQKRLIGEKWNVIQHIDNSKGNMDLEEAIEYCKNLVK